MTYQITVNEIAVSETTKLQIGDRNGDYLLLGSANNSELERFSKRNCCWCWWVKTIALSLCLLAVAAAFIIWGIPLFIDKVVVPILDWEMATFSTPVFGLLLFASMVVFPALLLPSAPCMWLAGMTFGYGYAFLLVMAGTSLGMSLPYVIGSLFRHRIHGWLENWPKKAAIVRLASEGNWFHQFRAVTLLRISPFPYTIFNYAAVATKVNYGPYILGSLVGVIPEALLTIYTGTIIRTMADVTHGGAALSAQQIVYNSLGFCAGLAATIAITVYAKRAVQNLQIETLS